MKKETIERLHNSKVADNFIEADLTESDLEEVNLKGANLEGANLLEARISIFTNLRRAKLKGANVFKMELADGKGSVNIIHLNDLIEMGALFE